ncbi:hypothetical protein [Flavobacterium phycosphaerae]|uniref:hypothetical protein n=1 Tax=Flavobacterium phycosphaerae TaxID=2697515 RepID=UPI00138A0F89|nr:hypothetical protein [Flavobacterium phycosphaerae]
MNKEDLKRKVTDVIDARERHEKTNFNYFKGLTTISVALIGLLIGLKPPLIPNQSAKILFLITICLIGLCILFSLIVQFYEVIFDKQKIDARIKILKEYIDDPVGVGFVQFAELKEVKFFRLFKILTFSCLILSIISLIFYVYFSEFYPAIINH